MTSHRPRRGRIAIVLTLAALIVTPAAAFTWDTKLMRGVQHFVQCWDDMWSNEAAHIRNCPPGPPVPPFEGPTANMTNVDLPPGFTVTSSTSSYTPP